MNKVQSKLKNFNKLGVNYYKKKAHKGIIGNERELRISEVNDLINDFVNFEMEWRIKTDTNEVEHFYFTDVNDITHYLEVNEENLNQAYNMLYMWYKGVLDLEGSLNIGDYNIVRKFYIYDFDCENLVYNNGLLAEEFEKFINEKGLSNAKPKNYIIGYFFEHYEIEVI